MESLLLKNAQMGLLIGAMFSAISPLRNCHPIGAGTGLDTSVSSQFCQAILNKVCRCKMGNMWKWCKWDWCFVLHIQQSVCFFLCEKMWRFSLFIPGLKADPFNNCLKACSLNISNNIKAQTLRPQTQIFLPACVFVSVYCCNAYLLKVKTNVSGLRVCSSISLLHWGKIAAWHQQNTEQGIWDWCSCGVDAFSQDSFVSVCMHTMLSTHDCHSGESG